MRYPIVFVVLGSLSSGLAAQANPAADPERRVWVREMSSNGRYDRGVKGTLEGIAGDTLFIRPNTGAPLFSVAPREGRQIFFSNGRRSSAGRGALIGTGVGVVTGAIIGFAGGEDCSGGEWLCFDRGTMAAAGALVVGATGLVAGIIVGAFSSHEVWVPADGPVRARPVVGVTESGVRVGMSIRF